MNGSNVQAQSSSNHLLWVYPVAVATALDSATWLRTTQELRSLGWQVTLVGKGPTGPQVVNGVEVFCLSTIDKYFLNNVLFHLRLLFFILRRWRGVDAIFFHQVSALWLVPLRLLRFVVGGRRPQLVMDTRDLNVIEGSLKNRLRRLYFDMTHALVNRWADGQTAITPRMAELVGIPVHQRWGCWPSGVSMEQFANVPVGRKWPAADEPVELIYIGKLHSERNLLPLCVAVEKANEQGANLALTFIGSGPEQGKLAAHTTSSNGRIRVLPAVSHEQIPTLLRNAHIGVTSLPLPNDRKFEASSPIKLFEYMAAGMPIFSTSNSCHTDVVGEGQYAFWAHGVDAHSLLAPLLQIEARKSQLSQLGEEARHAVQAWSWRSAGVQLDHALKFGLAQTSSANPATITSNSP